MLAHTRPEVTLRLVNLYFETRRDDLDEIRALQAKAEALATRGDFLLAAEAYRAVLAREQARPSYTTGVHLDYPLMVATEHLASEYECALSVLDRRRSDVAFPIGRFKWNAAYALILVARGDTKAARPYALAAVAAAQEQSSEFRQHRGLGLVDASHEPLIKRLKKVGL